MLRIVLFIILGVTSAMAYHIGELNINNKDIEAQVRLDMGQFYDHVDPDTTYLGFRYLHGDADHSEFEDNIRMFEINAMVQREVTALPALTLGMGIKLDYVDTKQEDFSALPLGMEATYRMDPDGFIPVRIGALIYYAPEVLSFSDSKRYLEYKVHVDLELIDNGFVTTGYRYLDTKFDQGDGKELNTGLFLGFKVKF